MTPLAKLLEAALFASARPIASEELSVLDAEASRAELQSALDELVMTDTIPLGAEAKRAARIRQLSVAELLAETIRRIRDEESVSSLYVD